VRVPTWLKYRKGENENSPVYFIDIRGTDFSPESVRWQDEVNRAIGGVLRKTRGAFKEPVLLKCHIGERNCRTRMLPEFCISTVEHFRAKGMHRIVCGDTTVAYSGDRGYHDNNRDAGRYLALAEKHGWTRNGPLRAPFVVLDRPQTSVRGSLSFRQQEVVPPRNVSKRFSEVYLSGGFAAAGTIVNHVHLTLHDMAQVACAVKGITMGGSSYKGKLIMHKCYSPEIDSEGCRMCGTCAVHCPEKALHWTRKQVPRLDRDRCIGCGECIAVCHGKSIKMASSEIKDWTRGQGSLPYRMADYIMGMMHGRWQRLLNIVHLYNITRRCDCVDKPQRPIVPDIGFLVGRNPFAVDLAATRLLQEELHKLVRNGDMKAARPVGKSRMLELFFERYHGTEPYMHIKKEYGIVVEPKLVRIRPGR
jgi:uncharacterized Fe-S center protein